MNGCVDSCAIAYLLTLHPLDVDSISGSAHLAYLDNLLTFVVSSNHLDPIVLAHGNGVLLLLQLLGE